MVVGGNILMGNDGGDKESGKVGRGLIVEEEVGERVRKSFKEGDNGEEGSDVGGGGSLVMVLLTRTDPLSLNECVRESRERMTFHLMLR